MAEANRWRLRWSHRSNKLPLVSSDEGRDRSALDDGAADRRFETATEYGVEVGWHLAPPLFPVALAPSYSVRSRVSRISYSVGLLPDQPSHGVGLPAASAHGYSTLMSSKLAALLERLKAQQRTLILEMAEHHGLPAGSALRKMTGPDLL